MKNRRVKTKKLPRTKRATITFNELELLAIEKYCKKYKVQNKAKFMRETIMRAVLTRFTEDYPTLWDHPNPV